MNYREITKCRISGSTNLVPVMDLGTMALSGVFPRTREEKVTTGPIGLVYCPDSGLLQLKQSYNLAEMYGNNYGYRSGLNASMVRHLRDKVAKLQRIQPVDAESSVLDIGGNDGTLLKSYHVAGLERVCIDPTVEKWAEHYVGTDIRTIAGFFAGSPAGQFDIITSIAMFYDLENPHKFVQDIAGALKPEGIWHFEQSYMPAMLRTLAYDTIVAEHLEFYTLRVVKNLLEANGLHIIDVELNDVNGGSFAVTACHQDSKRHKPDHRAINLLLAEEDAHDWLSLLKNFAERTKAHRHQLRELINGINNRGDTVAVLGASTKGNTLLNYCGFTHRDLVFAADVNPLKHGCFTPGSLIPIVGEEFARAYKPDYFLVGPWHFRRGLIEREKEYLAKGGHLIFPLPEIEIV